MKLSVDRIVDAGLETYAEVGYHALSMRQVARRLDAQAGSLYYHVADKATLVRLMADRVAQQAYDAGTVALEALPDGQGWQARVVAQATALRATIRRHPGGAQLLAAGPAVASTGALQLSERLLGTLADAGVPASSRGIAADALLSHVTGFVLQEQRAPADQAPDPAGLAALATRFPRTFDAASADLSDDETFERSVELLCAGIATLVDG